MDKIKRDSSFKGAYGRPLLKILYVKEITSKEEHPTMCKQHWLTIPVVMHTQKNFFLLQKMNEKIELLMNAGLINLWRYKFFKRRFMKEAADNQPKVLYVKHLMGVFQIWLLGCLTSLIVFIIEYLTSIVQRIARSRFESLSPPLTCIE